MNHDVPQHCNVLFHFLGALKTSYMMDWLST